MDKKMVAALCLSAMAAAPVWAENTITLTVDGTKVEKNPVQITFDGDNATLVFDNQETSTVDMALVSLAFQYDNQASAIRSIKGDDKAQATAVYNLNGQRISPLSTQNRKGIYIINNKKIVK